AHAVRSSNGLVRNQNMTKLPAESILALHHIAIKDDAAAIARADDDGNRALLPMRSEDGIVPPECRRIGIVQISYRLPQTMRQTFADIKPCPIRMDKVRRSSRAEPTRGAGGSRRVPTNRHHVIHGDAGLLGGELQSVRDLLQADIGAFPRASRMLKQILDQEFLTPIEQGVVDGSSAQVHSGHGWHDSLLHSAKRLRHRLAEMPE